MCALTDDSELLHLMAQRMTRYPECLGRLRNTAIDSERPFDQTALKGLRSGMKILISRAAVGVFEIHERGSIGFEMTAAEAEKFSRDNEWW